MLVINPNLDIANGDQIAYAAQRLGISYDQLIHKLEDCRRRKYLLPILHFCSRENMMHGATMMICYCGIYIGLIIGVWEV